MAGYEVTLEDFRRLLGDPSWRPDTAPLLARWYGYRVLETGAVIGTDGEAVDIPSLHAVIQADPDKQGSLYRTAMTLWR